MTIARQVLEAPGALAKLWERNIPQALIGIITDEEPSVGIAALGAMKNVVIVGGDEVGAELVNLNVVPTVAGTLNRALSAVPALLATIAEHGTAPKTNGEASSGSTAVDTLSDAWETVLQGVGLLSGLVETSELASALFGQGDESLIGLLVGLIEHGLNPLTCPVEVTVEVGLFLLTLCEDYNEVVLHLQSRAAAAGLDLSAVFLELGRASSSDAGTVAAGHARNSPVNAEDLERTAAGLMLLQVIVAGLVWVTRPLDGSSDAQALEILMPVMTAVLGWSSSTGLEASLAALPANSELVGAWSTANFASWKTRMLAVQTALEMLANMAYTASGGEDGFEDVNDAGDEEWEDLPEETKSSLVAGGGPDAATAGAFAEAFTGLVFASGSATWAGLWNHSHWIPDPLRDAANSGAGVAVGEEVVRVWGQVQERALGCLTNIMMFTPTQVLQSQGEPTPWAALLSLAPGVLARVVGGGSPGEFPEAVVRAMVVVARHHAEFLVVDADTVKGLASLAEHAQDASVRVATMELVGAIVAYWSVAPSLDCSALVPVMAEIVTGRLKDPSILVICHAANALMEGWSEDVYNDSLIASGALATLQKIRKGFSAAVMAAKRGGAGTRAVPYSVEDISMFEEIRLNIPRYLEYKQFK